MLDDNTLARLVNILHEQRLGLGDVERDVIGSAYEYMLRKFAERGSSAGEFFTPTEVGQLLAYILDPQDGDEIHDPAVGSAGLLIKAALRQRAKVAAQLGKPVEALAPGDVRQPVRLCAGAAGGQRGGSQDERLYSRPALRDPAGKTLRSPAFVDAGGGLRRFGKIAANPMWNQDFALDVYNNDSDVRPFWLGHPTSGDSGLGVAAAHVCRLGAGRADGGRARHGGGQPGQREQGARRRARHPQAVCGS